MEFFIKEEHIYTFCLNKGNNKITELRTSCVFDSGILAISRLRKINDNTIYGVLHVKVTLRNYIISISHTSKMTAKHTHSQDIDNTCLNTSWSTPRH